MKRGNIRTAKLYEKENGKTITRFAVQVRMRGRQNWVQAKKGEVKLVFDTKEEAEQVVIDYMDHLKQEAVKRQAAKARYEDLKKQKQEEANNE